ncbi:MAG: dephospho-CoA kinase [Planctomycetia bacterium]|nr:dephospho-CoA kinase [Planctomycetia bacterium]
MKSTLPVLGLVGGIGSGKSYIASLFAMRGAIVLDADKFGHEALLQPAIKEKIKANWGDAVFGTDGEVDRKALGHRVFSKAEEKLKLEGLVFPYIGQAIKQALELAEKNPDIKLAILDAAILLETGWKEHCSAVIFVDASLPVRLQRVAKRGWSAEELYRREATQWPLEQKKSASQHIIPNEGDEVFTERLVNDLINRYSRQ